MSTDTIAALECLPGWVWGPAHPHNDPWHRGLAAVERYSRTQHTVDAPTSVVITGVRVRAWVEARRSDYQAGALTPDRIAALEGISGWSWHARTTRWDRGLHAATMSMDNSPDQYSSRRALTHRPTGTPAAIARAGTSAPPWVWA